MQRDIISVNLSNPWHNVTERQQRAALRHYIKAHRPGFILCQEAVANLKAPRGYAKYGPRGGGITELAIFVKKGIDIVAHGHVKSVDGVAGQFPDRGLNWVQTDDGFVPINLHPNSHIDLGGRPLLGTNWAVTRSQHFPDMDRVIDMHRRSGHRVAVFADWNIDKAGDRKHRDSLFPFARMRRRHRMVEVMYRGETLGNRAVDRGFYDPTRLRQVKAQVLAKASDRFDHKALLVRLRYL